VFFIHFTVISYYIWWLDSCQGQWCSDSRLSNLFGISTKNRLPDFSQV